MLLTLTVRKGGTSGKQSFSSSFLFDANVRKIRSLSTQYIVNELVNVVPVVCVYVEVAVVVFHMSPALLSLTLYISSCAIHSRSFNSILTERETNKRNLLNLSIRNKSQTSKIRGQEKCNCRTNGQNEQRNSCDVSPKKIEYAD